MVLGIFCGICTCVFACCFFLFPCNLMCSCKHSVLKWTKTMGNNSLRRKPISRTILWQLISPNIFSLAMFFIIDKEVSQCSWDWLVSLQARNLLYLSSLSASANTISAVFSSVSFMKCFRRNRKNLD